MLQKVSIFYSNVQTKVEVDIPENCPHCGNTMSPIVHFGISEFQSADYGLDYPFGLLAQCTFRKCKKYYALSYTQIRSGKYSLISYSYNVPIEVSLPDNIKNVSPDFVEIYTQAAQAEAENLNQIAGVGYRKAAEFLIKDYAILNNPNKIDSIKNMRLGNVIATYLSDFPKVQTLATAVAWIGNDETHYVRKHTDKDITDLKRFIISASQFIAADYDVDEALNFTS